MRQISRVVRFFSIPFCMRDSMAVEEITILLLLVLLFLSLCAQLYIVFMKLYTHICSVEVVWFMLLLLFFLH
ncbi:Uncharacterized protein TCM_027014 [Theobroma cacao]|uniref:Uncharacterized protein n=1 Tax=Theobroma cacao TaxID=3641 RepID=A0A061G899_THECC|nr:Uncharacterized protein TCM_027014 [Theobroma cacao]